MGTWVIFPRRNKSCQNTPISNNGDDRKCRRQQALRALIRWMVNGSALCLVHRRLFHTSWGIGACIGISVGAFSALLQYHVKWLKVFYEHDSLAAQCEKYHLPASMLLEGLRWSERFSRWLLAEVIYVIYSEIIRALFGIDVVGSSVLIGYLVTRLIGVVSSTASQGAWELIVNYWRDALVKNDVCTASQADNRRDWCFMFGSLVSVSSLAASLSPYPKLGHVGFGVLVLGTLYYSFKGWKLTKKQ